LSFKQAFDQQALHARLNVEKLGTNWRQREAGKRRQIEKVEGTKSQLKGLIEMVQVFKMDGTLVEELGVSLAIIREIFETGYFAGVHSYLAFMDGAMDLYVYLRGYALLGSHRSARRVLRFVRLSRSILSKRLPHSLEKVKAARREERDKFLLLNRLSVLAWLTSGKLERAIRDRSGTG
jgi:hypothetical protein